MVLTTKKYKKMLVLWSKLKDYEDFVWNWCFEGRIVKIWGFLGIFNVFFDDFNIFWIFYTQNQAKKI